MQTTSDMPDQRDPSLLSSRARQSAGGILVLLFFIVGAGLILGGEVGQFVSIGIVFVPFMVLAVIGIIGLEYQWARILAYLTALGLQGLIFFFTMSYALLGVLDGPIDTAAQIEQNLQQSDIVALAVLALLLLVLFGLCLLVLLPAIRPRLAAWLPIDPDNYTHAIALWVVLFLTASAFTQLIMLGGSPPLLNAINTGVITDVDLGANRSALGQNLTLVYQMIWMVALAFVAAGVLLRRDLPATLERLGLVVPSRQNLLLALGATVGLLLLILPLGEGINWLWQWLGWPLTDDAAFAQLLGDLVSPVGALVIGITAGVGEEITVRGLLQPRLGIVLSNLAFTSFHAYQYGFDALLIVFILGLLLGLVRKFSNTTTAALVHAGYNASVVLLSLI